LLTTGIWQHGCHLSRISCQAWLWQVYQE
jgi:hypothetical protein